MAGKWLTAEDAAKHCKCSKKTLGRAVAAGQLRVVRLAASGRFRFRAEWLDRWLLGDAPDSVTQVRQAGITGNTPESPESDRFAGSHRANVKVS